MIPRSGQEGPLDPRPARSRVVLDRYLHSRAERHGADALNVPTAPLLVHYDDSALTRGRVQYVIEQLYRRAGLRAAVPPGRSCTRCATASRRWRSSTARVVEICPATGSARTATNGRRPTAAPAKFATRCLARCEPPWRPAHLTRVSGHTGVAHPAVRRASWCSRLCATTSPWPQNACWASRPAIR